MGRQPTQHQNQAGLAEVQGDAVQDAERVAMQAVDHAVADPLASCDVTRQQHPFARNLAKGGDDSLANLLALCANCHKGEHRQRREVSSERAEWLAYFEELKRQALSGKGYS